MAFPPKKSVPPVAKGVPPKKGKFSAAEQLAKAKALRSGGKPKAAPEPDGDESA